LYPEIYDIARIAEEKLLELREASGKNQDLRRIIHNSNLYTMLLDKLPEEAKDYSNSLEDRPEEIVDARKDVKDPPNYQLEDQNEPQLCKDDDANRDYVETVVVTTEELSDDDEW